jgi:hypothetical protein
MLTADADRQMWTSPWWKQKWTNWWRNGRYRPNPPGVLALLASHSDGQRASRLRHLMWASLSRTDPDLVNGDVWRVGIGVPGIGHWPGGDPTAIEPPASSLRYDMNRRGLRGHHEGWYYGVMKGRGQRNTLIGGMKTQPGADEPTRGILRGVWVEAEPQGEQQHNQPLWLSLPEPEMPMGLAWSKKDRIAAVGARYSLQPKRYGETADLSPTPHRATQSWVATPTGTIGLIQAQTRTGAAVVDLTFRIALGPDHFKKVDANTFTNNALTVKMLTDPGHAQLTNQNITGSDWPCVVSKAQLMKKQPRQAMAVWIGPASADSPKAFSRQPTQGPLQCFSATTGQHRELAVLHNPTNQPEKIHDDLPSGPWHTITLAGSTTRISDKQREHSFILPPGATALLQKETSR